MRSSRLQPGRGSKVDRRDEMMDDLDPDMLCEIDINTQSSIADGLIRNVRQAGGYRWAYRRFPSAPAMSVPDIWTPPAPPGKIGQIGKDIDLPGYMEIADSNTTLLKPHHISSFEPLFHSLPSPDSLAAVRCITNRNLLRRLYRLCDGCLSHDGSGGPQDFRVDAQRTEGLVLLHRWEQGYLLRPRRVRSSTCNQTYKTYVLTGTLPHALRGPGCQQVVTYDYAGMRVAVRLDVDACARAPGSVGETPRRTPPSVGSGPGWSDATMWREERADDRIWTSEGLLKLDPEDDPDTSDGVEVSTSDRQPPMPAVDTLLSLPSSAGGIEILSSNYIFPALSTFLELKTLQTSRVLNMADYYAQLVFSQTEWLYVARHVDGDFSQRPVDKIALHGPELAIYAIERAGTLRRVARILAEMRRLTEEHGNVSFVAVDGRLRAYRRTKQMPELSAQAREVLNQARTGATSDEGEGQEEQGFGLEGVEGGVTLSFSDEED